MSLTAFAEPHSGNPDDDFRICNDLSHPNIFNFVLSVFLLVGILVSYLPQHIRIIARRSSFGISPYWVLLGATSGTCGFANILTLPASRADIACCHVVNGFACFAGLLGIAQVGVQWTCFMVILLLFLIYFPAATPPTTHPDKDAKPSYRTAISVVAISIFHAIITIIISLVFIFRLPKHLQAWANILGVSSAMLAGIQYLPQIYTTYQLKRVGSLSIPMMLIQTPGSFVWAASLAARVGVEGWSTWGIYILTGLLQGTLLVMAIYFEIVHRRREERMDADGSGNAEVVPERLAATEAAQRTSETTPLLGGSHS